MRLLPRLRPYAKPIGCLLLGVLLLELLVRRFHTTWELYSPDDYRERVQRCASQPRDFVLVGGSPVSEGLNPDCLVGLRWKGELLENGFAIGLPGGTSTDVYYAVKHGCPTWPKLLVYGIAPSDVNDSRNEPHGPASLMSVADWREAVSVRPEARSWLTRRFWQARGAELYATWYYQHGIRMWAADRLASRYPASCPESAKEARRQRSYAEELQSGNGYAPAEFFATRHYSDLKKIGWVAPSFDYLRQYKVGSHLRFVKKLAHDAQAQGCQLVLLDMPLTEDLETRHPTEIAEYRRALQEFVRTEQLPFVQANRDRVGLDDTHFADLIHLNRGGTHLLSGWLKVQLQQLDEARP